MTTPSANEKDFAENPTWLYGYAGQAPPSAPAERPGSSDNGAQTRRVDPEKLSETPPENRLEVTEQTGLLLDEVFVFVRGYVVVGEAELVAISLWILHTHAFEAAYVTPYLWISSPEKACGKSTLLRTVALLVARPLKTANISPAALFRVIEADRPTVLFDELDSIFGPKARGNEDLRGILNAGFEPGEPAVRCGGKNMTEVETFDVFCPKLLAGIGELPGTIASRSIAIMLKRKTAVETVEKFRARKVSAHAEPLRQKLEAWAPSAVPYLAEAEPEEAGGLSDRAEDCWEPLSAIADLAGGSWPERARSAAVALSGRNASEDTSRGVQLLTDIRTIFTDRTDTKISSVDLIRRLSELPEAPWATWNTGAGITQRNLATLLKPYEIAPTKIRIDKQTTIRGYYVEQFEDAFTRYLSSSASLNRNIRNIGSTMPIADRFPSGTEDPRFRSGNGDFRLKHADVPDVPLESRGNNNSGRLSDSEIERLGTASFDELQRLADE